jgi:hypothetical protein
MTADLLNDWTDNPKFFDEMPKVSDGAQMAKLLSTTNETHELKHADERRMKSARRRSTDLRSREWMHISL